MGTHVSLTLVTIQASQTDNIRGFFKGINKWGGFGYIEDSGKGAICDTNGLHHAAFVMIICTNTTTTINTRTKLHLDDSFCPCFSLFFPISPRSYLITYSTAQSPSSKTTLPLYLIKPTKAIQRKNPQPCQKPHRSASPSAIAYREKEKKSPPRHRYRHRVQTFCSLRLT